MIEIKANKGVVELQSEGATFIITAEAVASNISLIKTIANIQHVSFENAALFLMQESIKYHTIAQNIEEHNS